jgi:hypothetical protein
MAHRLSKKLQTLTGKDLIDQLEKGGVSPVEVMVSSMRKLFKEYEEAEGEAEVSSRSQDKEAIMRYGKDCLKEACEIAKNVAPYFHARLQATTISGDGDKPPISVELTSVGELRKFLRGGPAPAQSMAEEK